MSPDDPRHGTYAGWQTHIRTGTPTCEPCRDARRTYQRDRHNDAAQGNPRRVDPAPIREHIEALINGGMTTNLISQRSGVHPHTIRALRYGNNAAITADHAEWLMAVTIERDPNGLVSCIGAQRRIQALARLGWASDTVAQVANSLGYSVQGCSLKAIRLGSKPHVRVSMHEAIAAAYDALSMRPAPAGRGVNSLRTRAANAGWPPPLAWDNIDDPNERPNLGDRRDESGIDEVAVLRATQGHRTRLTIAERREVVRILHARGLTDSQIGTLTGMADRTALRIRGELGLPAIDNGHGLSEHFRAPRKRQNDQEAA